ncbi:hypothetical protein ACIBG8_14795 [Nonomuraea sp. NPDC050556]|uniref:hypothetical protein n=1 Tax=Nonomuraea sp. NPDC050556 TaxID=3364369 RepID=UPI0037A57BE4
MSKQRGESFAEMVKRLREESLPGESRIVSHPLAAGEVIDDLGRRWVVENDRVTSLLAKRLMRTSGTALAVIVHEDIEWIADDQRLATWERCRKTFKGPLDPWLQPDPQPQYTGTLLVTDGGDRLLCLQLHCC